MLVQGVVRDVTSREWNGKTYRDVFVLEDGARDSVQISLRGDHDWTLENGDTVAITVRVEAKQTKDKSRAFLSVNAVELVSRTAAKPSVARVPA